MPEERKKYRCCSFCNRDQSETRIIYSSGDGVICEECLNHAIEFIDELPFNSKAASNFAEKIFEKFLEIDAILVRPRFIKNSSSTKEKHIYYLGPLEDPFNEIYEDHILKVAKFRGYSLSRASYGIFENQSIIEDIWENINKASIIIADVSEKNPTAMYEIGFAHAAGKSVLILTQDINDVPFDLRNNICVIYEYTPIGCKKLELHLEKTIEYLESSSEENIKMK